MTETWNIDRPPTLRGSICRAPNSELAVLLCHGLPVEAKRSPDDPGYTGWAQEVAESGFTAATFDFRGCYDSDGDLDFPGWVDDIVDACARLHESEGVPVVVAASSLGGAAALAAAPRLENCVGIATLAAPAELEPLVANDPEGLLERVQTSGLLRTEGFPSDVEGWADGFRNADMLAGAKLWGRPLLVLQGEIDDVVLPDNAKAIAEAASGPTVLSLLPGVGHRVRHDPVAKAQLIAWIRMLAADFGSYAR